MQRIIIIQRSLDIANIEFVQILAIAIDSYLSIIPINDECCIVECVKVKAPSGIVPNA